MRLGKDFDPMVIVLSTDESFLNWFYFNTPILDNTYINDPRPSPNPTPKN